MSVNCFFNVTLEVPEVVNQRILEVCKVRGISRAACIQKILTDLFKV